MHPPTADSAGGQRPAEPRSPGRVTGTRRDGPALAPGTTALEAALAAEFERCHLIQKREQDSGARKRPVGVLRGRLCASGSVSTRPAGLAPASWEPSQGRPCTQSLGPSPWQSLRVPCEEAVL